MAAGLGVKRSFVSIVFFVALFLGACASKGQQIGPVKKDTIRPLSDYPSEWIVCESGVDILCAHRASARAGLAIAFIPDPSADGVVVNDGQAFEQLFIEGSFIILWTRGWPELSDLQPRGSLTAGALIARLSSIASAPDAFAADFTRSGLQYRLICVGCSSESMRSLLGKIEFATA